MFFRTRRDCTHTQLPLSKSQKKDKRETTGVLRGRNPSPPRAAPTAPNSTAASPSVAVSAVPTAAVLVGHDKGHPNGHTE